MKKVVIYLIYFLFILPIYAQGVLVEMTEEEKIDQKLANYINLLNSQLDRTTIEYSYVLKNVSIQDTTATAVCDIIIIGDTVSYLQNENIELVKNYEWKIKTQSLGDWFSGFNVSKSVSQQYNNLRATSTEPFQVKLSENSMISNRLYSNVYEINSTLTMSELNRKLFSDDSEMDGAILYHGSDGSRKTAFITDRKWRRVVYATTTENEIKSVRSSIESPLLIPVAIAVHTNSNTVFVADKGNRQICRFFYSEDSNTLTSNPISYSFLNYTKVRRPVDIELSDDEEYLFVCDSETKSIKKFDLYGNLVVEITGDANYTLNSPMFIEPYGYYIVVIDKDINGNYNIVWLLDDDNIYSEPAGTFAGKIQFPSGSLPTDLSQAVDNRLLVPDNGNKMIHSFFGGYICSFNGNSTATNSDFSSLGRMPTIYNAPGNYIYPYFLVAEDWTTQSGIKYYAEGADILDLKYRGFNDEHKLLSFSATVTNISNYSIDIIRKSDNVIILSETGTFLSGSSGYNITVSYDGVNFLNNGNYELQISVTPKFNSGYSNPVPAITKSLDFCFEKILTGSHIWSGNVIVPSNVTIAEDATLTIAPGSNITFNNNSSLIVNGTLTVNGASSNNVVLDFGSPSISSGNGLKINSGSTANLTYTEVTDAYMGIIVNGGALNLNNSKIKNSYMYGVWLRDAAYSEITNSYIENNGYFGIYLDGSSPLIQNNMIRNNSSTGLIAVDGSQPTVLKNTICDNGGYGVVANDNSSIAMFGGNGGKNKIISNSLDGIKLLNSGSIYSGPISSMGENSIYSNTDYDLSAYSNSTATMLYNYWGTSTPSASQFYNDGTAYLSRSSHLTSDHGSGSSLSKASKDELVEAYDLYANKQYDEASELFKEIISKNIGKDKSIFALDGLRRCSKNMRSSGFEEYLNNTFAATNSGKNDKYKNHYLLVKSGLLEEKGEYEASKEILNRLLSNYDDNDIEKKKYLLFKKAKLDVQKLGDITEAKDILAQMYKLDPKDESIVILEAELNLFNEEEFQSRNFVKESNTLQSNDSNVSTFELVQNHPNPFNPTTTISYQIPEQGFVTLKVYDMLGREVADLVNNKMEAGKYSVNFNANNLASGVYIYRINVQSFEGSKSLYSKTEKMMLLK